MLYTRKGDSGTTKDFKSGPGVRKSKSSCQTETLGALDELNSFIGLVKVKSVPLSWTVNGKVTSSILDWTQNCLFIIQAEVAGAEKTIGQDKLTDIESLVDAMEKEMPPIKTFFISGGTEMAALLDVSRTLARKAERQLVSGIESEEVKVGAVTLAFMNRLSSLFYAMARFTNFKAGLKEVPPAY